MKRHRDDGRGTGLLLIPHVGDVADDEEDDFIRHCRDESPSASDVSSSVQDESNLPQVRGRPPPRKRRRLTAAQNYVASLPPIDPVTGIYRDDAYALEEAILPPEFEPLDVDLDNELQERCLLCNYGHPTFDKGPNGFELFADMCNTLMVDYATIGVGGAIRKAHTFYDQHIVPLFQEANLVAPPFDSAAIREHLKTLKHSINSHLMLVQQIRETALIKKQVFSEMKEKDKRCDKETVKLYMMLSKHLIFLYSQSPDKRMTFAAPHRSEFHPDTIAHVTRTHALAAAVTERRIQPHVLRLLTAAAATPAIAPEGMDEDGGEEFD
jgi:hypothetical protein